MNTPTLVIFTVQRGVHHLVGLANSPLVAATRTKGGPGSVSGIKVKCDLANAAGSPVNTFAGEILGVVYTYWWVILLTLFAVLAIVAAIGKIRQAVIGAVISVLMFGILFGVAAHSNDLANAVGPSSSHSCHR